MPRITHKAPNAPHHPKPTPIQSARPFNARLSNMLMLLLLVSVFLFNTNAGCRKPETEDHNTTANNTNDANAYNAPDYHKTEACDAPDYLFHYVDDKETFIPNAVGKAKSTGTCTDGLKSGTWTFEYRVLNPTNHTESKEISQSGTGSFEKGKKVGDWVYQSTDNKFKVTESYQNGILQKEEALLYQNGTSTLIEKSILTFNNQKLQKEEITIYQENGTNTESVSVTTFHSNGKKQKWERITYYKDGVAFKNKTVVNYDSNGNETTDASYTYKNDKWEEKP